MAEQQQLRRPTYEEALGYVCARHLEWGYTFRILSARPHDVPPHWDGDTVMRKWVVYVDVEYPAGRVARTEWDVWIERVEGHPEFVYGEC